MVPAGTDDGTDDGAAVEKLVEANPLGSRLELLIVDRGVKADAQRRLIANRGVRVDCVGWDEPQLDEKRPRVFRPSRAHDGSRSPTRLSARHLNE